MRLPEISIFEKSSLDLIDISIGKRKQNRHVWLALWFFVSFDCRHGMCLISNDSMQLFYPKRAAEQASKHKHR
jgi:hypothetical protein